MIFSGYASVAGLATPFLLQRFSRTMIPLMWQLPIWQHETNINEGTTMLGAYMFNRYFFFEWRQLKGVSQRELAQKMGVHHSVISKVEAGKIDFKGAFLGKYANAIGCDPGDLLSGPPGTDSVDAWISREVAPQMQAYIRKRARELAEQLRDGIEQARAFADGETPPSGNRE